MKEHEDPPSFPSPLASSLAPSSPGCRYLWCSGAQCVPRKRTQTHQAEAPQTRICEENTVAGRRPHDLNFWDPICLVLGIGNLGGAQELRTTPGSLAPPLKLWGNGSFCPLWRTQSGLCGSVCPFSSCTCLPSSADPASHGICSPTVRGTWICKSFHSAHLSVI